MNILRHRSILIQMDLFAQLKCYFFLGAISVGCSIVENPKVVALCGDADHCGVWWWRQRLGRCVLFCVLSAIVGLAWGQFLTRQMPGLRFHA